MAFLLAFSSRPSTTAQRPRLWGLVGWLAFVLLLLPVGCKRVASDRQLSAETRKAITAIQQYSAASDRANDAHRAVLTAFADANRSANLPEYKNALRNGVLPAMDTFITRLSAMPAGTPELAAIHAKLLLAYTTARTEVDSFEAGLQDAAGLARFDDIRKRLQAGVAAYSSELARYYARFDRKLRLDGASSEAAAVTGTAAP